MTITRPAVRRLNLMATVASISMTWGPVIYGWYTHPLRTHDFFSAVGDIWEAVAILLATFALITSAVILDRGDRFGVIGLVGSLAVLTFVWTWFIPMP